MAKKFEFFVLFETNIKDKLKICLWYLFQMEQISKDKKIFLFASYHE